MIRVLTPHQAVVLSEAKEIIEVGKRLVIQGSAGVGKTFMVHTLIENLRVNKPTDIYCTAPTHKAVAVIKEKVLADITFTTIHSALKMKRSIGRGGEWSFKPKFHPNYPPLANVKYLIIDEASMIDETMLDYIEEFADAMNTTVIFLGDEKQLNPVGEDDSPVFMRNYPTVTLTEIVRQGAGNPIIDLSRDLNIVTTKVNNLIEEEKGYLFTLNRDKVIQELAEVNGTDEFKYLSYTNQDVNAVNKAVRMRIYGGNPAKIELDETLVFNSPLGDDYFTNEEIKVESLESKVGNFDYPNAMMSDGEWRRQGEIEEDKPFREVIFKYYLINGHIPVIHEDSEKKYKDLVATLKQKAKLSEIKWPDFYSFVEQFADLKYNHALTIHKSQGSTYKKAVINLDNINYNRNPIEKKRLLYTAITRASDLLIILKK